MPKVTWLISDTARILSPAPHLALPAIAQSWPLELPVQAMH